MEVKVTIDFSNYSLTEIKTLYKDGIVTKDEVADYLSDYDLWDADMDRLLNN